MANKSQILGLQVLRGIAACMIVLYHYTSRYNEVDYVAQHTDWYVIFSHGCFAVSVFFLISGYLTSATVVRQERITNFIKKRINRLYPTFWAAMLFTYAATKCFGMGMVTFRDLLGNISMIPMVLGLNPVDGVYWTQQCELFFYGLVILILYVSKPKFQNTIFICWLLLSLFVFFFQNSINIYLAKALRVLALPDYSPAFAIGFAYGLYCKNRMSVRSTCLSILISFFAIYLWHGYILALTVCAALFFLMYVTSKKNSSFNKESILTKPFLFIASISYPLYLLHQKIGFIIISKIIEFTGYDKEIIIIPPILVSVILAYLLHRYVESNKNIMIFK